MKSHSPLRPRRLQHGFTLVELMITIVLAALIAGFAIPNMRTFILNSRLSSTANDFLRATQSARSEAAKRQGTVVLCMSSNAASDPDNATCAVSNLTGWIVFRDTNSDWVRDTGEDIIELNTFDSTNLYLLMNNSKKLSFSANGFANPAGSDASKGQNPSTAILLCDKRGNTAVGTQSTARGLDVIPTGRARMMRTVTEVDELLTTLGSTCPP